MPANCALIETHHPAVQSQPVTGFITLNVTPASVRSFVELTAKEPDKLLEILEDHYDSPLEHIVRFNWKARTVAMWDHRYTAHKSIPGVSTGSSIASRHRLVGANVGGPSNLISIPSLTNC